MKLDQHKAGMMRPGRSHARAFTLLELLVTMTIIAVIASVVTPMLSDDSRLRVMAASEILRSDIELAGVMSVSFPDNPVVIRFDTNHSYWLAYASDPETPMMRAGTTQPYVVVFGSGRASGAADVMIDAISVPDGILQFDAQGGLVDFTSAPTILLQTAGSAITLAIAPTTGTITESNTEVVLEEGEKVEVAAVK